jgi:hypothetical protein
MAPWRSKCAKANVVFPSSSLIINTKLPCSIGVLPNLWHTLLQGAQTDTDAANESVVGGNLLTFMSSSFFGDRIQLDVVVVNGA